MSSSVNFSWTFLGAVLWSICSINCRTQSTVKEVLARYVMYEQNHSRLESGIVESVKYTFVCTRRMDCVMLFTQIVDGILGTGCGEFVGVCILVCRCIVL